MVDQTVETAEAPVILEKQLPSLESFPEESREIIGEWVALIKKARQSRQDLGEIWKEIGKTLKGGTDYWRLWGCVELKSACQKELVDEKGEKIPPVESGMTYYLLNRRYWPDREKRITKGESLFSHTTNHEGFKRMMKQNEIACRARQKKPQFTTGLLKFPTQEMHDVSFDWDTSRGVGGFGGFTFIVPADAALKEAVFCDCDGIHVLNKNTKEGYIYDLSSSPYVVIVGKEPTEEELHSLFGPTYGVAWEKSINFALKELGWSKEDIDSWKEKHLVIGDQRDEEENASIRHQMTGAQWNLRPDQLSPIKQRILQRLKAQNYFPSQGKRFYPVGEKTDLGVKGREFWLYELR